jgi:hypothetical protein
MARDVTGDGRADLVIFTGGGGNDMVASNGLEIISWQRDSLRVVYGSDHGDPELQGQPGVHGLLILNHQELWPPRGSHADVVEYVSDILAFRNGTFTSVRKEQSQLFMSYVNGYIAAYRAARDEHAGDTLRTASDSLRLADSLAAEASETPSPLYVQPALALISLELANQPRMIRSFWSSERDYIRRRIPASDFQHLETIYMEALNGKETKSEF